MVLSFEKFFQAYLDCRKRKRNSMNSLFFEYDLEKNLCELYDELVSGSYKIGISDCFIVIYPKPREVWAADFRDRIVHHLVYNEIKERFYNRFIKDTYSCIPLRGTGNAIRAAEGYARMITCNYTKKAYYLKADIKNFFVSINKDILYKELTRYVDEEWLLSFLRQIIYNDIKSKVRIKSPRWKFNLVPSHKSLWNTPDEKGLPIGNLTSQFFSNVYLNILDQYVKHKLKCKYYCRYVDDFILMSEDASELNRWHRELTVFLKERLDLELHQNKKTINVISKGIDFVGGVIKPNRTYLRQKTIKKIYRIIRERKNIADWYTDENLNKYINTINSYLGMLRNVNGYNLRRDICSKSIDLFIGCDAEYTKIFLNSKKYLK